MEHYNNNNKKIKTNNNNNNNKDLFLILWRNVVIKRLIFKMLKIYKFNYEEFRSRKELIEYEDREYITDLKLNFNEELQINDIPFDVRSITFGDYYNFQLKPGILSNSPYLRNLILGSNFNQKIEIGCLPESLEEITFGYYYNQPFIEGALSVKIKTITFLGGFNSKFQKNQLPLGLKNLIISGYSFNEPLIPNESLPPNLESLRLSNVYNQVFKKNSLPSSLKYLHVGDSFNQTLDNLPLGLEHLVLGPSFNKQIETTQIPSSIKSIVFENYESNFKNENDISITCDYLKLGGGFNKIIDLSKSNIKTLEFGDFFNQSISSSYLPSNITSLIFGSRFNWELGQLPSKLVNLSFGLSFNKPLNKSLPSSLKSISFGHFFDCEIKEGDLPNGLESIIFGYSFNKSLTYIPKSIKYLTLSKNFSEEIKDLPLLQVLTLDEHYCQPLNNIPTSTKITYKRNICPKSVLYGFINQ